MAEIELMEGKTPISEYVYIASRLDASTSLINGILSKKIKTLNE